MPLKSISQSLNLEWFHYQNFLNVLIGFCYSKINWSFLLFLTVLSIHFKKGLKPTTVSARKKNLFFKLLMNPVVTFTLYFHSFICNAPFPFFVAITQLAARTSIHAHNDIYIYIYIYKEKEGEREGEEREREKEREKKEKEGKKERKKVRKKTARESGKERKRKHTHTHRKQRERERERDRQTDRQRERERWKKERERER